MATRKLTLIDAATTVMTAVFWDSAQQEFQVRQKECGGVWIPERTYYTDNREDAYSTCNAMHARTIKNHID